MKITPLLCLAFLLLFKNPCQSQSNDTDPYLWLEEIEDQKPLEWVKTENALSDKIITASKLFSPLQKKILNTYNDKDKIAYPELSGKYVYNLWKDEKNQRGLWRCMIKSKYINGGTYWETVLDIDELSKKENKNVGFWIGIISGTR